MPRSNKLKIYRRCYCLLPEEATAKDVHGVTLGCGVGGHPHLNFAELYGSVNYAEASAEVARMGAKYVGRDSMLSRGEVEWAAFPRVLRLRREPEKRKAQRLQFNDLSAQVGAFLAEAKRRMPAHTWPHVLLADMRRRRLPRDEEVTN